MIGCEKRKTGQQEAMPAEHRCMTQTSRSDGAERHGGKYDRKHDAARLSCEDSRVVPTTGRKKVLLLRSIYAKITSEKTSIKNK